MSAREWTWVGGGEATVVAVNGDHVSIESTRPSPPGSTLEGRTEERGSFFVKVRACRRADASARFRIEGRLVNLTRSQRAALSEA